MRNVVGSLSGALNIRERGTTGIVDFRYTGPDRDETVRIVNTVVEAYQDHNLRRRAAEIDQSIDFIEEQLPELRAELRQASTALSNYRQSQDGRELSISTQELLAQTVALETEIENLAFRREQLLQRLTPNHPDYRALEIEQERLQDRLADFRTRLADVPEAEQELARLTQQVERARLLELQLVNRVEQLRILRASTVGNIFVLEPAEVGSHIGPNRRNPIAIGAALGFILSALGIFGLNAMRRGIEDARDIEDLGLSLFGTVNKSPALVNTKASEARYGMAIDNPRDIVVEAIRGLRTGLRFSLAASQSKSLMITSCAPGDGKSFISLNLAVVSGQTGSRVLLIDSDMRRGFLRQYFGLARNAKGLSDVLSGSAAMNEAIQHYDDVGIDFMPTGAYPPNPAELLASPAFESMISELSPYYDLLIFDAPPVLAVADPGIIGQSTGMSLLVIRHLVTSKMELQSAQKTLANSGITLSGCVLNQFDMKAGRYGAYGAQYGSYYGGYNYKYD
jgi:tyrosine-protein kinase Etk/Wzc